MSLLCNLVLIYFAPSFGHWFYPLIRSLHPDEFTFFFCFNSFVIPLFVISQYAMYGVFYSLKIPFFERYKSTDEDWPWETDPKEWWLLFRKTAYMVLFEFFLLGPAFGYGILYLLNFKIDSRMSTEDMPGHFEIVW